MRAGVPGTSGEDVAPRAVGAERPAEPSPVRVALASAASLGLMVALLFGPAGRLDWTAGWIYLGILVASLRINYACLRRWNPELIERRMHLPSDTKTWDKVWIGFFSPLFVAVYVVASLDAGRGGSTMPAWLWPVGLALFVPGMALFTWSMVVNPFFEKTVRIQTDRNQRVIDTGPYQYVRHPGYVGFFGWILSAPLFLGSWWALVPALLSAAGVIVRTALEDRTLREELDGYEDYARRVRFRLVPGVW